MLVCRSRRVDWPQADASGSSQPWLRRFPPLLPMTYVVEALRHTIDGGPTGSVVTGVLALLAYGSGALGLTVLVARRSRRLRMKDLYPELVI